MKTRTERLMARRLRIQKKLDQVDFDMRIRRAEESIVQSATKAREKLKSGERIIRAEDAATLMLLEKTRDFSKTVEPIVKTRTDHEGSRPAGTEPESRWVYVAQLSRDQRVAEPDRLQVLGVYYSPHLAREALANYWRTHESQTRFLLPLSNVGWVLSFQRATPHYPMSVFVGGGTRPFNI